MAIIATTMNNNSSSAAGNIMNKQQLEAVGAAGSTTGGTNTTTDDDDQHEHDMVMPGFRFHPTEEELVEFYLRRKVEGKKFNVELIAFLDLYRYDPWELPALAAIGEKEWFFYVPRDRKYRNGDRPNRVTTSGYWKATGADRMIRAENFRPIGLKKTLVFYSGKAPKGIRTSWIMNEYRLPQHETERLQKVEISLCRVYKRSGVDDHHYHPSVPRGLPARLSASSSSRGTHQGSAATTLQVASSSSDKTILQNHNHNHQQQAAVAMAEMYSNNYRQQQQQSGAAGGVVQQQHQQQSSSQQQQMSAETDASSSTEVGTALGLSHHQHNQSSSSYNNHNASTVISPLLSLTAAAGQFAPPVPPPPSSLQIDHHHHHERGMLLHNHHQLPHHGHHGHSEDITGAEHHHHQLKQQAAANSSNINTGNNMDINPLLQLPNGLYANSGSTPTVDDFQRFLGYQQQFQAAINNQQVNNNDNNLPMHTPLFSDLFSQQQPPPSSSSSSSVLNNVAQGLMPSTSPGVAGSSSFSHLHHQGQAAATSYADRLWEWNTMTQLPDQQQPPNRDYNSDFFKKF